MRQFIVHANPFDSHVRVQVVSSCRDERRELFDYSVRRNGKTHSLGPTHFGRGHADYRTVGIQQYSSRVTWVYRGAELYSVRNRIIAGGRILNRFAELAYYSESN